MKEEMKKYLDEFERKFMIQLVGKDIRAYQPYRPVPVNRGKLHETEFGLFLGDVFNFGDIVAFNYYGMYKVSEGIKIAYKRNLDRFPGIKLIQTPVINFASVLPEEVGRYCPELYPGFNEFKKYLVKLRWKG